MEISSVSLIICCSFGVLGTVKVSKVKGHADDGMVLDGRVRDLDR